MPILSRRPQARDPKAAQDALEAQRLDDLRRHEHEAAERKRRDARTQDKRDRKTEKRDAFKGRATAVGGVLANLTPLLLVNAVAVGGQLDWAVTEIVDESLPTPARYALGALIALGAESIAVTVGWYAHDALRNKLAGSAARLRRGSYLIAGVIGFINYWHFATGGDLLKPTAASWLFSLCSIMSPILWGLYSRRAHQLQLRAEGASVDFAAPTFSPEKWRTFPLLTLRARRWAIFHNVSDPKAAWLGYHQARAAAVPQGRVRLAWAALTAQSVGVVPAASPAADLAPSVGRPAPAQASPTPRPTSGQGVPAQGARPSPAHSEGRPARSPTGEVAQPNGNGRSAPPMAGVTPGMVGGPDGPPSRKPTPADDLNTMLAAHMRGDLTPNGDGEVSERDAKRILATGSWRRARPARDAFNQWYATQRN